MDLKEQHILGIGIYECVKFGAAYLNVRALLGLGRGMRSNECHSICVIHINLLTLLAIAT